MAAFPTEWEHAWVHNAFNIYVFPVVGQTHSDKQIKINIVVIYMLYN